jgi:hypothetical protein
VGLRSDARTTLHTTQCSVIWRMLVRLSNRVTLRSVDDFPFCAGRSMDEQMGRYAGIHCDERDCPGHYSTMITRSRLPPNYVPPRMILPGLGLYTNLYDFVGLTFQARHEHVRSPAYPRIGTQPLSTAYRFALIHYTPERVASGDTRLRIGALPTTQTFLALEMRSSK